MEYCSYNEAFGNPYDQQIKEYNRKNNNIRNKRNLLRKSVEDYQKKYKLSPPHEINDTDIYHSYFNAQGDLDRNLYPSNADLYRFNMLDQEMNRQRMGTKISDLRKNEMADKRMEKKEPSLSSMSLDSLAETNSDVEELVKKPKYSHNYYIKKFLQDISDDGDTLSLTSSQDDVVYEHIKKCKYCKTQINKNLKQQIQKKPESVIYPKILPTTILGYDIKEIIIIILVGICLIFVLDLFVKIGKAQ